MRLFLFPNGRSGKDGRVFYKRLNIFSKSAFGKNAIVYAVGNIGLRAASFLLIPIYTHSLSMADYGVLATLLVIIQILSIVMDAGMRKAQLRFSAECEEQNRSAELLGTSILINLTSGAMVTVISVVFLLPLFRRILYTDQVVEYVVLSCCAAAAQSLYLYIVAYYRTRKEPFRFITANVCAAGLLFVVSLVLLTVFHQGIKAALIAQVITYGGLWFVVAAGVLRQTGIGVSAKMAATLLRYGLPLIFVMSGHLLTDAAALFLLSYFKDLEEVAVYSLGYKLAQIAGMVLILPFQLEYESFVYANVHASNIRTTISRLLTNLMFAFVAVAFVISFVSRDVLSLIAPPAYSRAYLVVLLSVPFIAFDGVSYIGESLLHIRNKTHVTAASHTTFSLLGIAINYVLIPYWGMYGVVAAFAVNLAGTAVCLMVFGMKSFPIPLEWRRLGASAFLMVSLLAMTFFLGRTNSYMYYGVPSLTVGGLVAALFFAHRRGWQRLTLMERAE